MPPPLFSYCFLPQVFAEISCPSGPRDTGGLPESRPSAPAWPLGLAAGVPNRSGRRSTPTVARFTPTAAAISMPGHRWRRRNSMRRMVVGGVAYGLPRAAVRQRVAGPGPVDPLTHRASADPALATDKALRPAHVKD